MYRIYVEKRPGEDQEARALAVELHGVLGLPVSGVRIVNRYDAEGLGEAEFRGSIPGIFSDPPVDVTYDSLEAAGVDATDPRVFAVEFLPGQFDQRADSAAQCIQMSFTVDRPLVRSAIVYVLEGELTDADVAAAKAYLINPVESCEAGFDLPETLSVDTAEPADVAVLEGFKDLGDDALPGALEELGLAMDLADLALCRDYFASEDRDPTVTEMKVIDTYWSDHCRHTTFNTELTGIDFADPTVKLAYENYIGLREELGRTKPISLMDMGTIGAKALRARGQLERLDISDEINACTVKIDVSEDGESAPWLLLFKNETHNHPTEIEPFGGAATCVGGAIRDPLSGRGYVYGAMRISGGSDPRVPISQTREGKLPQRTIAQTAAAGNASYGNQIGLAAGIVDEIYHPGYEAKHMELGAVIAAVPEAQVRREEPTPGDVVVLVGGATGRDGIGGATGSSKEQTVESVELAGAEVQKGNAPEERKLQRLFRNPEFSLAIKRCNDFGAGGVSVAVGELTDGLDINLDVVPTKYAGLDGTEIAVSESQERMAIVVEADDVDRVIELAAEENLSATPIATVTDDARMTMYWRGAPIVDLSRAFLDTNGAPKSATAHVRAADADAAEGEPHGATGFADSMRETVGDLNVASKQGLSEGFDSTVGAGTVLMPFGGTHQETPIQAMVHRLPVRGETEDCSLMSWGYNPDLMSADQYRGAYAAVVESVAKLVATGADMTDVYLSFQEYFEALGEDPARWGKPVGALLGALEAQLQLGVGAIGGKDSMSGSFEELDVPPTLVSFAVTTQRVGDIVAPQLGPVGAPVTVIVPDLGDGSLDGLPTGKSLLANFARVNELLRSGEVVGAWAVGFGGIREAVFKMGIGERRGLAFSDDAVLDVPYGSIVLAWAANAVPIVGEYLGEVTDGEFSRGDDVVSVEELRAIYNGALSDVYPATVDQDGVEAGGISAAELQDLVDQAAIDRARAAQTSARPADRAGVADQAGVAAGPTSGSASAKVLIPVFPGTNCEYDTARAVERAGMDAEIFVIRNRDVEDIERSIEEFAQVAGRAQAIVLPGGFSGGDEPNGSAKFMTSFLRNAEVSEAISDLMDNRGGLMLGICNGFQALIKLGLVPYGTITEPTATSPTLTLNRIGRHQSHIARVKVTSTLSPWLAGVKSGEVYNVPISHGEGRFTMDEAEIVALAKAGQFATQYVDLDGKPTLATPDNPNGSLLAVEGLTSPDGRIFGKMGHAERIGSGLYRNIPGEFDMRLFESAAAFFA